MDRKCQKIFKINKKNPTYGSNKITDYFSKIRETTEENQIIQLRVVSFSQRDNQCNESLNNQRMSRDKTEFSPSLEKIFVEEVW